MARWTREWRRRRCPCPVCAGVFPIGETWLATRLYQVREAEVVFGNGMVRVETETLLFERFAWLAFTERMSLSSTGCYATPKVTWDRDTANGRPFLYFACGAACSKVTVDSETGEMRVDKESAPLSKPLDDTREHLDTTRTRWIDQGQGKQVDPHRLEGPGKVDQLFDVSLVGLPDHAIQLEPGVSSRAAIRGQRHRGGGGTGQRGAVAADFGAGRLERLQTLGHRVGLQMKVGVVDVGDHQQLGLVTVRQVAPAGRM